VGWRWHIEYIISRLNLLFFTVKTVAKFITTDTPKFIYSEYFDFTGSHGAVIGEESFAFCCFFLSYGTTAWYCSWPSEYNVSILVCPLLVFSNFLRPVREFIIQQKCIHHPNENY